MLRTCFPEISDKTLEKALKQLDTWSFTIFKKYLDAYAVFAGSDFNIDRAVGTTLDEIRNIDYKVLNSLPVIQPILAKRHYHKSGTLRWFSVNTVPVRDLVEFASKQRPDKDAIGQFILAVQSEDENDKYAEEQCIKATSHNNAWDTVIGISDRSRTIVRLARELFALDNVSKRSSGTRRRFRCPARGVRTTRDIAGTFRIGVRESVRQRHCGSQKNQLPKRLRRADLNNIASELADSRFEKSPFLHNELLNRKKPSGSAIAAQNILFATHGTE